MNYVKSKSEFYCHQGHSMLPRWASVMWVDAVDLKDTSVTGCHRTVKHLLGSLARIEIEIEIEIWISIGGDNIRLGLGSDPGSYLWVQV